jgi:REP element-mobilizing transposase RayT
VELEEYGGVVHACTILPDHFHLVIGPHRYDIRRFIGRLKGAASRRLREEELHPFGTHLLPDGTLPSPWGRLPWVVYLWNDSDVMRSVRYVEENPLKVGLPRQRWGFVTRYVRESGGI